MDNTALFKLSYGLFAITVKDGRKLNGCIVNTVIQVTASPIRLSVAVNKDNLTNELLRKSGKLAVSVLSEDTSMNTIAAFGFRSGKDCDKFADFDKFDVFDDGLPYVNDNAVCVFKTKVVSTADAGTHTIFILDVEDAIVLNGKLTPMTYSYYHTVKKGTTPKNASSYVEAKEEKKGWRCTVCNYVYEGEELPADYICPICKNPADVFVKL